MTFSNSEQGSIGWESPAGTWRSDLSLPSGEWAALRSALFYNRYRWLTLGFEVSYFVAFTYLTVGTFAGAWGLVLLESVLLLMFLRIWSHVSVGLLVAMVVVSVLTVAPSALGNKLHGWKNAPKVRTMDAGWKKQTGQAKRTSCQLYWQDLELEEQDSMLGHYEIGIRLRWHLAK